tara:strand:- start:71 stop:271 length:201 start_codon:yes stop_codon:yes gene_type:complete
MQNNNTRILLMIKDRLEKGAKKYHTDVPLDGDHGRDNLKEAIEEALDLSVYLSAVLLSLHRRDNGK